MSNIFVPHWLAVWEIILLHASFRILPCFYCHHHRLFWKRPFLLRQARVRRLPHIKSLQTSLKIVHSGCRSSNSLSWLILCKSSCPYISPHHFHIHASQQKNFSSLLCSRCPNHLNLLHFTTSATLPIPRRLYKSSLHSLSLKDTTHSLTIIPSLLFRPCRYPAFIAHVSVPYVLFPYF